MASKTPHLHVDKNDHIQNFEDVQKRFKDSRKDTVKKALKLLMKDI